MKKRNLRQTSDPYTRKETRVYAGGSRRGCRCPKNVGSIKKVYYIYDIYICIYYILYTYTLPEYLRQAIRKISSKNDTKPLL